VIESRYPERDSTVPGSRYSDCYMSVTKCEHLRMGASPGTNAQVFAVNKDNKRERERETERYREGISTKISTQNKREKERECVSTRILNHSVCIFMY
jgi:hypothetical protein